MDMRSSSPRARSHSWARSGVAGCHFLQREQPGGVATDARGALAEHHLGDLPGLPRQARIAHVYGDATERHHPRRVQDTDDLGRHVHGELALKRGGGVGQTPHLQELPAAPGLEDAEGPALPVALSRGDTFRRHLERLIEAVDHRQQIAAPLVGEVAPGVVAGAKTGAQSRLHHLERSGEISVGVHEPGLGQFQREPGGDVVASSDRDRHLFEHGAGFIASARRHQVVEQQRQVSGPQVGRETGKGEGLAALLGAHVGGYGEHTGDAEADLGFLLRRERLVQRRVGERFRLLAAPGGVQPDRGLSHQRPSQRMPSGSKLKGALAQVGGRAGVGCRRAPRPP